MSTDMSATGEAVINQSNKNHALLSASGAHKWLNCTPSARLEENMPESESIYANEGRLAHEIGELKLKKAFVEPMGPQKFKAALKKLESDPLFQDEMLKHTDTYFDYISGIVHSFNSPPYIRVEKRIDFSAYAPEGFGTGDCIIIGGNVLHVCDFKYGKGVPVSAEYNPQMMLYALGAYTEYSFLYPIERVKMAIIQPRLDSISEFEMSIADLLGWGECIKPNAQKAFNGEGEFISGEWCRFCRAKALCRARSEFSQTIINASAGKLPPVLSNEEVGAILAQINVYGVEKWIKDLEEYALTELLKGNLVPGWKAVEGRSVRQFDDTDEAFKVLIGAGFDEAILYERKPLTLAAVEKLLGKAQFNKLLKDYYFTPPGKPTLAPVSDKRIAISNRTSAAEDFGTTTGAIEDQEKK
jgi:hypothetical protein